MALDQDVAEIKEDVKALRRRPVSIGRAGLYIMTFWALVNTCHLRCDTDKIIEQTKSKMPQATNALSAEAACDTRKLFGADAPETFCDVNGKRYFLEIDGKPVAEYLKGRQ